MTSRDPIALITGAHGFGISAALIGALAGAGVSVINLDNEREDETRHRNQELMDRIDILDMLIGTGAGDRPDHDYPSPVPRRELQFNDTPKPLSKRRARRLRGRAAA